MNKRPQPPNQGPRKRAAPQVDVQPPQLWQMYFPEEGIIITDIHAQMLPELAYEPWKHDAMLNAFQAFFVEHHAAMKPLRVHHTLAYTLHQQKLLDNVPAAIWLPSLQQQPAMVFSLLALALHQAHFRSSLHYLIHDAGIARDDPDAVSLRSCSFTFGWK
jgi:hypothetical protein